MNWCDPHRTPGSRIAQPRTPTPHTCGHRDAAGACPVIMGQAPSAFGPGDSQWRGEWPSRTIGTSRVMGASATTPYPASGSSSESEAS
ncbi:hypothetical protein SAMN04489752_2185 [Brevibacterium siliguriense]|uniref:Uncharacterized protein n=1 Tax=Brevibacterium siliguriense TaxID=1136497 RepID=A0A1H1TYD6_9MICO|nr:hypothetical protein SAMN04489752_2185 [Brevibacterium siliguriense]